VSPGCAGDRVLDFDRVLVAAMSGARDATNLRDARPRKRTGQAGRRFQAAMLSPAVSLVARFSRVEKRAPLEFARRGKKRAETQPRSQPSTRVGCPSPPADHGLRCR
jgi:hypothetical protein